MKICSKCKVEKLETEFHKDASETSGLTRWCKSCQTASIYRQYHANPDKARTRCYKYNMRRLYRMTPDDKAAMIASQKGCCACCGDLFTTSASAHIDHIHGSQPVVVRGILCPRCNVGLGNFKDSTDRLLKAVEYLKKFQEAA